MHINGISIKNFRCFKDFKLDFEAAPIVLISGDNGTGKTSLLEAIHYMCYMKSFRTASPRELLNFDQNFGQNEDNFFIKANFLTQDFEQSELSVGFSQNKRLVKLNKKSIESFKDLFDYYRVVTLVEDDLMLIKGGPEVRRDFIDHAIILVDPSFLLKIREFKKVLQNRNSLLLQAYQANIDKESYSLWTEQLWHKSIEVQAARQEAIFKYQDQLKSLLVDVFKVDGSIDGDHIDICLEYKPKKICMGQDFATFLAQNADLMSQELAFKRSLFGAHLDDFLIKFNCKKSRSFASRGQQKLIVLLLKVAQIIDLKQKRGAAIFLLDDFMTDFDEKRGALLINFLASLKIQLIFTSPTKGGFLEDMLVRIGAIKIELPG